MSVGRLRISPEVASAYPTYRAAVLYATGLVNGPSSAACQAQLEAGAAAGLRRLEGRRPGEEPRIAAWRRAFSSFGAKPSRYPCSVEALLTRSVRDGAPPAVNALVDAYNAISLEYLLPIGGEDWDRLVGDGVLRFANGEETFVVFHGGDEEVSHPADGEVVWADEEGVTCRRWNWRQCRRTQLTEATTSAYFLLEAIDDYPDEDLEAAAEALTAAIRRISPDAEISRELLRASDPH